jgi:tetratricopeptide (TPR) repeat protein
MGKLEQGIADLEWFLARHPDDPAAHYELGQAERTRDAAEAHRHLDKALELDPNYVPARLARGDLFYQEGRPEAALQDLEAAASLQPENAANLDRLGQTYQALERTADALGVLRRAAELAPEDSKTVLHYARALAEAGQTEDSRLVMERFRQLGPEKTKGLPPGLVEYLSLPPAQRRAEYRARVEKTVRDHPDDPAAQVEYLKLTIRDGAATQVAGAAQRLAAMKPGPQALAEAGHALVDGDYYALALDVMAGLPESARGSDYFQARAQMLDASGKSSNAALAIEQAIRLSPERPELYLLATALLVKQGRTQEALRSIGDAARRLPENREVLLMKATTLEFAGQGGEAAQLLREMQNRWPEWPAAWTAYGMLLAAQGRYEEARPVLETAAALGSRRPETYFYLADCMLRAGAERKAAAESAIGEALKLAGGDPWIQALAGRIAAENGRHQLAVDRLRAALRQRPQLSEARGDLARAYRALGRQQEAESEAARAAKMPRSGAEDAPPYLRSLFQGSLARERPPRDW